MKKIKIALLGTQHDYAQGLLPFIVKQLGYAIEWSKPHTCDLLIYGAFYKKPSKPFRYLPKPLRPAANILANSFGSNKAPPLSLFHTCENVRHDFINTDFSISFDLGVQSQNHLRLPYWMEMVDWSHEGIIGNQNPRFGELLSLKQLSTPLGSTFLSRPRKAALITSHLLEPRKTVFELIGKSIPTEGFGPYFDKAIRTHNQSNFIKKEVLKEFAFNLCPENSLYPGYYTEKIPEAFMSGCLPIGWADENIRADFNPKALINLEPMAWNNFEGLNELLHSEKLLEQYCEQPLLTTQPSLEPAKVFIQEMLRQATS